MKKFLIPLTLFLIFLACFPLWLPKIGTFLVVDAPPVQADCLTVLRGEDFFKMNKAIDLYRQGFAKKIVICTLPVKEGELWDYYQFRNRVAGGRELTPKEFIIEAFRYLGFKDAVNLQILEADAKSTYDEAIAVREWMVASGLKSMLLVADSYHARRALIIFSLAFRGTSISITPVTASNPNYRPQFWWRSEKDVKRVLEEYVSILFNYFYHFTFKKESTSFDTV